MDDDELNRLLTTADPAGPVSARARADLARMSGAAAASRRRRQPWKRALLGGAVGATLLGGATAAAASAGYLDWAPWAQAPDAVFVYTLPSGTVCEERIGNVQGLDPDVVDAIRAFLASSELPDEDELQAAIEEIRSEKQTIIIDGVEKPSGYGTPYYDEDREYARAVDRIRQEELEQHLHAHGFGVWEDGSYETEGRCE